jgi:NCS1 family nucleobase:cation symporter-1
MGKSEHDTKLEELGAIPDDRRSIPLWSYIALWWSSLIVVQAFAIGFFGVYPQGQLNVTQAFVALICSAIVLALLFSLNCFPGYKAGIPFAVQARSSFGVRGAKITTVLRALPAFAWYGIGNWIGALAINAITQRLWGFGSPWVYFIIFLVLQTYLAIRGIKMIKYFDTVAAFIVAILIGYTLFTIMRSGAITGEAFNYPGSWGYPFLALFATGVAGVVPGILNISDVSRHLKKSSGSGNAWAGHMIGIAPPWFYMLFVGIIFGIATGTADPVAAIMELAPSAAIGVAMLVFVLGAQISTNLTLNILAPAHAIQDLVNVKWSIGVIITGALSLATAPWILFTSANFFTFMNTYSVFLGPIIGVLLADYWVVRKGNVDVEASYDTKVGSKYWYKGGFSISAIASFVIGGVASIPFIEISWIIGLPVGFVLYIILKMVVRIDREAN